MSMPIIVKGVEVLFWGDSKQSKIVFASRVSGRSHGFSNAEEVFDTNLEDGLDHSK